MVALSKEIDKVEAEDDFLRRGVLGIKERITRMYKKLTPGKKALAMVV